MCKSPDLMLLHPPAFYDFRKRKDILLMGGVAAHSTPVFEVMPAGFLSIKNYLEKKRISVGTSNIADRMLKEKGFDVPEFLCGLKPVAFGIGLQWAVHIQGALAIARLLKKAHPEIPIIFGGLCATYFCEELISRPEVDFVVRGSVAFEPLALLVSRIKKKQGFSGIPNLMYKQDGVLVGTEKKLYSSKDIFSADWDFPGARESSVNNVLFIPHFGCRHNCCFCSGSRYAFSRYFLQKDPLLFKPLPVMLREIRSMKYIGADLPQVKRASKMLIFSQWHQACRSLERLLPEIRRSGDFMGMHAPVYGFLPPRIIKEMARSAEPVIEFSLQSHERRIRRSCGCFDYSNRDFEDWVRKAINAGAKRVEAYFTVGLPWQTPRSVSETADYCARLLKKFKDSKQVAVFIVPIVLLDPGSSAYDFPGRYGYRILHRSLAEYEAAALSPGWEGRFNYETRWMTRRQIISAYLCATEVITKARARYGYQSHSFSDAALRKMAQAKAVLKEIERALACASPGARNRLFKKIRPRIRAYNKEALQSGFGGLPSVYTFWHELQFDKGERQ